MTDLSDGLAALLANPLERTIHCQLLDRLTEDGADARQTILAWVLANKANDGPRLCYAEWCERNGESERGEFVRVQCEMAVHTSGYPDDSLKCIDMYLDPQCAEDQRWKRLFHELQRRERELFAPVAGAFIDAPPIVGVHLGDALGPFVGPVGVVRRGFISHLTCTATHWLQHADAIVAQQPVERVRLTTYPFQQENVIPGRTRGELELELLQRRFPGIVFELPPVAGGEFDAAAQRVMDMFNIPRPFQVLRTD